MKIWFLTIGLLISFDAAKAQRCSDQDFENFKSKYMAEIQAARSDQGLRGVREGRPAMERRRTGVQSSTDALIHQKSQQTAARLYEAVKASVDQEGEINSLASRASRSYLGQDKKRIELGGKVRCEIDGPFYDIRSNGREGSQIRSCGGADATDVTYQSRMVMTSNLSAPLLAQKASARLVNFSQSDTDIRVQACSQNCSAGGQGFKTPNIDFMQGQAHYFQVHKPIPQFQSYSMTNYIRSKVVEVEVCGFKSYLMLNTLAHSHQGFDRASVVGLVSQIGQQSLMLVDAELQAGPSFSGDGSYRLPLKAYEHENNKLIRAAFGNIHEVYNKIGTEVAATEELGANGLVLKPDTSVALGQQKQVPVAPSMILPPPDDDEIKPRIMQK